MLKPKDLLRFDEYAVSADPAGPVAGAYCMCIFSNKQYLAPAIHHAVSSPNITFCLMQGRLHGRITGVHEAGPQMSRAGW